MFKIKADDANERSVEISEGSKCNFITRVQLWKIYLAISKASKEGRFHKSFFPLYTDVNINYIIKQLRDDGYNVTYSCQEILGVSWDNK